MSNPNPNETIAEKLDRLNAALTNPYQRWVLTLDGQVALIDAYVVLNAFPSSAQVDHAIKKLLALGLRSGGKSVYSDVRESRNQLNMELVRLERLGYKPSDQPEHK